MTWITLKTCLYWEADLMQQLLAAHHITTRIVAQGLIAHLGAATPVALQVQPQDQWTALLLLSPVEEELQEGYPDPLE